MNTWKGHIHGVCPHGLAIRLVDGTYVRNHFDSDFSQGGNGYRYKWIPKNEIWLDAQISKTEWSLISYHECEEVELMKKGMSYDKAHDKAKALEDKLRHENMSTPMKKKLTPDEVEGIEHICLKAIEYLRHPDVASLPFDPSSETVASSLHSSVIHYLTKPVRHTKADGKQFMLRVQRAADYLQSPSVAAINFALRSSNIARALREVVARMKSAI